MCDYFLKPCCVLKRDEKNKKTLRILDKHLVQNSNRIQIRCSINVSNFQPNQTNSYRKEEASYIDAKLDYQIGCFDRIFNSIRSLMEMGLYIESTRQR